MFFVCSTYVRQKPHSLSIPPGSQGTVENSVNNEVSLQENVIDICFNKNMDKCQNLSLEIFYVNRTVNANILIYHHIVD